ncbi:uncharacterized protein B0I36DRAFT_121179 [Microdochium trichocladiopsis]|uniref:Clr5 domain-containing protein n=1 Tax=Microdochium trichocladiopsis TaxID=1682393 RepID=A0A9P8Y7U0_9PEZI|nr:uncharacterized protein B0I36DRAFT_121179 [Microdochium trichocladiopsis]KAH7031298.1 hypothetical protein B0I36DRAFT_121179 [Microdochium trichocladiopsis]
MARPELQLEGQKDFIIQRYQSGVPLPIIQEVLQATYSIQTSVFTLRRRLKQWGIHPKQQRTIITDALRIAIEKYIFTIGLSDDELLR